MKFAKNDIVIWLTGLPGSGKTTLGKMLRDKLKEEGYRSEIIDGDWFRKYIDDQAGFTREERIKHLVRVSYIAKLLARNGIITICSFVSPYEEARKTVKSIIEEDASFYLVYLKCPVEECIKRDPKGLYKKALKGYIKNFTGIDDVYEEPSNPDLVLDTSKRSLQENFEALYHFVKNIVRVVS
ncbi:MAG: adenylyl-sulfate kinase [Caldisphaeraceae archaeon]|nr:adenylyl-sulfate kinase [Caldisphaeraceae archaeon]MEB3692491.1 adenylyl-sulfate kinase [Caldisphaeraceae archaeon]MEB3798392.1 adenylyl-sulfate kinase [Caldisphaeraceae archaeon]